MLDLEIAEPSTVEGARQPNARAGIAAAIAFLPLRLFLAGGWLRAASEKLLDPEWWDGAVLNQFITDQEGLSMPFFAPVLSDFVAPNAEAVSAGVFFLQVIVGVSLLTGRHLQLALRLGVFLNVAFILAGRVNPSVFYLVMEIGLLYAIDAGLIGRHPKPTVSRPILRAIGWVVLALVLSRWIETFEPVRVVEDPAMVMAFLCVILAVGSIVKAFLPGGSFSDSDGNQNLRFVRNWILGTRD